MDVRYLTYLKYKGRLPNASSTNLWTILRRPVKVDTVNIQKKNQEYATATKSAKEKHPS